MSHRSAPSLATWVIRYSAMSRSAAQTVLALGCGVASIVGCGDLSAIAAPMVGVAQPLGQTESVALAQFGDKADLALLKLGSKGPVVSEVQSLLQALGYDVVPDGVFGENTRRAVADFQKMAGLVVDGRVGSETMQRLKEAQLTSASTALALLKEPPGNPANASTEIDATSGDSSTDVAPSSRGSDLNAGSTEPLVNTTDLAPVQLNLTLGWPALGLIGLSFCSLIALVFFLLGRRRAAQPIAPWSQPDEATPTDERSPLIHSAWEHKPDANGRPNSVNGMADSTPSHPNQMSVPSKAAQLKPPMNEVTRLSKLDLHDELVKDLYSPEPNHRRRAIWELGQNGTSEAMQPLVNLLIDSDSNQRSLILTALSEIGARTINPLSRALLVSLEDENADVRKNAIRDVTRIYDQMTQISQILRHALDDPDPTVRETARWALAQMNRMRPFDAEQLRGATAVESLPEHLPQDTSNS